MRKRILSLLLVVSPSLSMLLMAQTTNPCNNANFQFPIQEREINCMQSFDRNASGVNNINAFLLSKMCELIYSERLDYQFRYLKNNREPVNSIPSSDWIKSHANVTEANFECAYASRFSHYFYDESKRPRRLKLTRPINTTIATQPSRITPANLSGTQSNPTSGNTAGTSTSASTFVADSLKWVADNVPQFKYIHKSATVTFKLFGMKTSFGLDPELMVISSKDLVLIIFRGTDQLQDQEWGEWIGTDFNAGMVDAGGALQGTQVHKGFWASFDLIRDQLLAELTRVNAKTKSIWVAGHSLGAAMAAIAGVYLKADGYPVKNVYGFAAPRTVGNDKFASKANTLLPNRIQRFEYYLDPITLMWAPGYEFYGKRNWMDHKDKGDGYEFFAGIGERFVSPNPLEFNRAPINDSRTEAQVRLHKDKMDGLVTELGWKFFHHNPQFYNKGLYKRLSASEKAKLPVLDDSFPYMYPSDPLNPYAGGK